MRQIALITLTLFVITLAVVNACTITDHKRYGENCSCSDICLDNSLCQRNENGGFSCQCPPCLVYNRELKQCVKPACQTTPAPPPPPTPTPTPTPSEPPCPAERRVDIVFVIDSSGSIGTENYQLAVDFVKNVISGFSVSENGTHVGVLTYGTSVRNIFPLTFDRDLIKQKLQNVAYQGSTTNTHLGLEAAINFFQRKDGGRPEAKKVIILVTDGRSTNPAKTLEAAANLRTLQIITAVVGVGSWTDENELKAIASKPEYKFSVGDYSSLNQFTDSITEVACNATLSPPTVPPCPVAKKVNIVFIIDSSGTIGEDNYKYNFLFISTVLSGFHIDRSSTEVALLTYGTSVRRIFTLTSDRDFILEKLKNVPYQGSTTNTHLALDYVLKGGILNNARPGVDTVVILVTDGLSTAPAQTLISAKAVKDAGITIATVGVGPLADYDELSAVATDLAYIFKVGDYSFLDLFASSLAEVACTATSGPMAPTTTTVATAAPTTTRPTPPPVIPCPVVKKVNIAFLIDSSGSIGLEKYKFNFLFIEKVLGGFEIGVNATEVGLLTYGSSVRLIFSISPDRAFIEEKLKNVAYQGSKTNTHLALRNVIDGGILRGARPDAATVVILVTDGQSSLPEETVKASQAVKDAGYTIATLGVGTAVDQQELLAVASKPEYNFLVGDYDFLDYFASSLADIACKASY